MFRQKAHEHVCTDTPDAYDEMYIDPIRLHTKAKSEYVTGALGTMAWVEWLSTSWSNFNKDPQASTVCLNRKYLEETRCDVVGCGSESRFYSCQICWSPDQSVAPVVPLHTLVGCSNLRSVALTLFQDHQVCSVSKSDRLSTKYTFHGAGTSTKLDHH